MKKIITILAVSVFFVGNMAAQSADFARWSAAIKGGITYYRIQPEGYKPGWSIFDSRVNNASWALPIIGVEYTVNPYYGIGIEGGWFRYNREGLEGSTVDFVFNNSINLSNLLSPARQGFWKKSTFYGNAAIGIGFYQKTPTGEAKSNGNSPVTVGGLEYNYNFNSTLALILEGQYRIYLVDDLGTGGRSNWNDDAFSANIGLRFKFHGKGREHVRDASVAEYYSDLFGNNTERPAAQQRPVVVRQTSNNKNTDAKIKGLEDQMNNLQEQLTALNDKLDNLAELMASDAAQKSEVDYLNDKIKKLEDDLKNGKSSQVTASFDEITFKTGSAKLSDESQYILARIVQAFKNGSANRKIRIFGHTDNVGSEAFNLKLSQERAETVKNFLVSHGVAEANIIEVKGMGFSQPVADNSIAAGRAQNRRVSFVIE